MQDSFIIWLLALVGLAAIVVGAGIFLAKGWCATEQRLMLGLAHFFNWFAARAAGLSGAYDSAASAWLESKRALKPALEIEGLIESEFADRKTAIQPVVPGQPVAARFR